MIKLTARPRGIHIEVAVRSGETPHSLGLCGNLIMRAADWQELKGTIERGRVSRDVIAIEEPKDEG